MGGRGIGTLLGLGGSVYMFTPHSSRSLNTSTFHGTGWPAADGKSWRAGWTRLNTHLPLGGPLAQYRIGVSVGLAASPARPVGSDLHLSQGAGFTLWGPIGSRCKVTGGQGKLAGAEGWYQLLRCVAGG